MKLSTIIKDIEVKCSAKEPYLHPKKDFLSGDSCAQFM